MSSRRTPRYLALPEASTCPPPQTAEPAAGRLRRAGRRRPRLARRSTTCPAAGELVAVDDLVLNIGGGAANTAVDLARLGVRAAICARVGDDIFGRFATETLRGQRRRLLRP